MSLRDFAARFSAFGVELKPAPNNVHPALPAGYVVTLALPVPAAQFAGLEEYDGGDPTEDVPPAGRRLRRVIRELRDDDDILAWRFVREGANGWLHLLMTSSQATIWYRNIDWVASTRVLEASRPGHRFGV